MKYSFSFTLDEINRILKGLGELAHKESHELIAKIVQEAKALMEKVEAAIPDEEKK